MLSTVIERRGSNSLTKHVLSTLGFLIWSGCGSSPDTPASTSTNPTQSTAGNSGTSTATTAAGMAGKLASKAAAGSAGSTATTPVTAVPAKSVAGATATAPTSAAASGGAGSLASTTAGSAGSKTTGAAGASAAAGGAAPAAGGTGVLPTMDVSKKGTWAIAELSGAGPQKNATVIYPKDLGKDGIKHPFTVWGNGAGAQGPEPYRMVTEYIASHGFPVYITNQSSNAGTELTDGITWMLAENDRAGSPFQGKLDPTKVSSMGHSMGALATFAIAKDPRLTTTLHLSGGTMPTHEAVDNLHAPAAFICGEDTGDGNILGPGDIATPNCKVDFMNSKVPTFFAEGKGLSHATGYNMMQPVAVAWMRWLLAGDTTMRAQFVGASCGFCKTPWVAMQKDLDKIP